MKTGKQIYIEITTLTQHINEISDSIETLKELESNQERAIDILTMELRNKQVDLSELENTNYLEDGEYQEDEEIYPEDLTYLRDPEDYPEPETEYPEDIIESQEGE